MSSVPLKEAIASGAWLECHAKSTVNGGNEREIHYRLRVLAFTRTSVEDISPSLVGQVLVEGILWLLSVEVVNLCKTGFNASRIKYSIKLVDEEGFEFQPFDGALGYDKNAGHNRFSTYGAPWPSPKIKATGSIAFVLPDEENNYYLAVEDGNIKEA